MIDGRPDPDRFDATIGELVRGAAAEGRPLSVYGETVSLLWDAGMVAAAIELEEFRNALGRDVAFTLLCGYRSPSLGAAKSADAIREVCCLHSHQISSPFAVDANPVSIPGGSARSFTADPASPHSAREFVTLTLQTLGADDLLDDAVLVVSELATNAVRHAHAAFTVTVACAPGSVRITVSGGGGGPGGEPVRLVARPARGLGIDRGGDRSLVGRGSAPGRHDGLGRASQAIARLTRAGP
jgi:anti-sigma regulatory factor (Ser/Thr protein kinase)